MTVRGCHVQTEFIGLQGTDSFITVTVQRNVGVFDGVVRIIILLEILEWLSSDLNLVDACRWKSLMLLLI
jgi:hypothetical protein